jgi:hypothetical protein
VKDLQDIVHEKANGIALGATEQPVDTGIAAGKAFLDMLGVFAKFETSLRRERQLEGSVQPRLRASIREGSLGSVGRGAQAAGKGGPWTRGNRATLGDRSGLGLPSARWRQGNCAYHSRRGSLIEAVAGPARPLPGDTGLDRDTHLVNPTCGEMPVEGACPLRQRNLALLRWPVPPVVQGSSGPLD